MAEILHIYTIVGFFSIYNSYKDGKVSGIRSHHRYMAEILLILLKTFISMGQNFPKVM